MEAPTYQTGRVENSPATVGIRSSPLRAPFKRATTRAIERVETRSPLWVGAESAGENGRVFAGGPLTTPRYQAGCIRT